MNKSLLAFFKPLFIFSLIFFISVNAVHAQPWLYAFGNGTGVFNTASSASTTFLPVPDAGTARVNLGSGGGAFSLVAGGTSLGSGTELQCTASTNSSFNKFELYGYTPGTTSYVRFDLRFANATAGNFYFYAGSGTSFSNNGPVINSQAITGIKWSIDAAGNIAAALQYAAGFRAFPAACFIQNTDYKIEIYSNNYNDLIFYDKSGGYTVAENTVDVWVNGVLIMDDAPKLSLPNLSNIDSWMFYSENSNAGATMILDNISYANDITMKQLYILPVRFANFKATTEQNGTHLYWENKTEQDILNYVIERSSDGSHFSSVATIKAVLNNGSKSSYNFIDASAAVSNYYRIKATEKKGSEFYSDVIHIQHDKGNADVSLYPNPVINKKMAIEFNSLPAGSYQMVLVDGARKEQLKKTFVHDGGSHTEIMQLPSSLTSGIYYVSISNGSMSFCKTILVN